MQREIGQKSFISTVLSFFDMRGRIVKFKPLGKNPFTRFFHITAHEALKNLLAYPFKPEDLLFGIAKEFSKSMFLNNFCNKLCLLRLAPKIHNLLQLFNSHTNIFLRFLSEKLVEEPFRILVSIISLEDLRSHINSSLLMKLRRNLKTVYLSQFLLCQGFVTRLISREDTFSSFSDPKKKYIYIFLIKTPPQPNGLIIDSFATYNVKTLLGYNPNGFLLKTTTWRFLKIKVHEKK